MANRYSKYQLSEYKSQYVDPGTTQVATILRDRYDKNKAKHDMITRAAKNMKVGEGDMYLKTQAIDKINNDFSEVAASGNYENMGSTVDAGVNDFVTNEGLQLAAQSYQTREEEIATARELEMKTGRKVLDFGAVYDEEGNQIGHQFDAHRSFYQAEDGTMVRSLYRGQSELQLDYAARKKQLTASIAKSGGRAVYDHDTGKFIRWEGVSQAKANRIAEELYEEYLTTDEGRQEVAKLTRINGMSEEDAQASIISSMQDIASIQVGMSPSYMDPPEGWGMGNSTKVSQTNTTTGATIKAEGMDSYTNQLQEQNAIRKELEKVDRDTPEGKEYAKQLRAQLTNIEKKIKANMEATVQNTPGLAKVYDKFKKLNAKNEKYNDIEQLLFALTEDTWHGDLTNPNLPSGKRLVDPKVAAQMQAIEPWKRNILRSGVRLVAPKVAALLPFGPRAGWFTTQLSKIRIGKEFSNVRDIENGQEGEVEELTDQFCDTCFEKINRHYDTEYTQKDMHHLREYAKEYYNLMKNEKGDRLYAHVKNNMVMEESDEIEFAVEGTQTLSKVNKALTQNAVEDFVFIDVAGTVISSEDMRTEFKKGKEDSTETVKNFTFAGIRPATESGRGAQMSLKINGKTYTARPKATSTRGQSLLDNILRIMGREDLIIDERYAEAFRNNELSIGEYLGYQETKIYSGIFNITGTEVSSTEELQGLIDNASSSKIRHMLQTQQDHLYSLEKGLAKEISLYSKEVDTAKGFMKLKDSDPDKYYRILGDYVKYSMADAKAVNQ